MLAKAGIEVSGIDLSPAMLGVARAKSPPNVSYFLGNAEDLPFGSGSFDCVTISLALHEMAHETRMKMTGEILRVLTPDGKLIVFDYAALQNWGLHSGLGFWVCWKELRGESTSEISSGLPGREGSIDFSKPFPLRVIGSKKLFSGRPAARYFEKEP